MNETITIDGKDYEVLTLDRIGEITHARLAGGKVVDAIKLSAGISVGTPTRLDDEPSHGFYLQDLPDFGIQPLKLIERVPVEFEATFALVGGFWTRVTCLDDGIAYKGNEQKKFRCVEITEEV